MYQGRRPICAQNAADFIQLYGGRGENPAEWHGETYATYARPTGELLERLRHVFRITVFL
jgi:hypothetical protein